MANLVVLCRECHEAWHMVHQKVRDELKEKAVSGRNQNHQQGGFGSASGIFWAFERVRGTFSDENWTLPASGRGAFFRRKESAHISNDERFFLKKVV